MKCLDRNKSKFYFSVYNGKEPVIDEDGYKTGEYKVKHCRPIKIYANISPAKGETQTQQFGEDVSYDKVLVMDNFSQKLDEYSWLWIDRLPLIDTKDDLAVDDDGEIITPHDYIVTKVAQSLNSVAYAIRKVTVSGN